MRRFGIYAWQQEKMIADVTRHYFDYGYTIAEELACKSVTVHQGFVPGTSYASGWIKRGIPFWLSFFEIHLGSLEVNMENLCEKNPETLIGILDGVQNQRLSVNLDIGHAYCNSDLSVKEWIEQLGSRIHYVHIHQNNGIADRHWGLPMGNMPMENVLGALETYAPDAVCALECAPDDMEASLTYLAEMGYMRI